MIDIKQLKELVKLMAANDLTELDLQGKDERVTLKRGSGQQVQYVPAAVPAAAPAAHAAAAAPAPAAPAAPAPAETGHVITSPMVGTFYAASSPDAAPFVTVGAKVGPESVVCLVEAMKVFNEIKAETAGTITKVLVESGQAVEYGQPLFVVEPA